MIIHGDPKDMIICTWGFTSTCNFACEYCPEHLHDNKVGFPNIENALHFVSQLAPRTSLLYFELLGGETTLWPELIEFLSKAKKYPNVVFEINTNGSRTSRWWEEFCEADLSKNTVLNFSYHAAQCNADIYYKNMEIASVDHQLVSNFMLDPNHFYDTKALFDKTSSTLPVDCLFKVLRQDFDPSKLVEGYTEEMLEIIKTTNNNQFNRASFPAKRGEHTKWPATVYRNGKRVNWQEMVINKEHKFKGWQCSAGSQRFVIGLDGSVSPCSLTTGKGVTAGEYSLGNINDRNVKILDKFMECPVEYCACKMDALAEKFK